MPDIIINKEVFRQYKDTIYYVSKKGEVYSDYCKCIIKGSNRNLNGKSYKCVDITNKKLKKRCHVNIHKMVYTAWNGEIPDGAIIRHLNDNSLDNRLENLSCGTQKDNIYDCFKNNHRVGSIKYITIQNKKTKESLTFCPCTSIYEHFNLKKRESLERILSKKWFKEHYVVIKIDFVKNLEELNNFKGVTTNPDECRDVE